MGVKVREKEKGSGVWWVFVNHNGDRASTQVGSLKAANKTKEDFEARLKLGLFSFEKPSTSPTVKEYFERFENTYLKTAVTESTADRYETNFRVHVLPVLASKRLDAVSQEDMENLVTSLVAEKKLAKATIETIVRTTGRLSSYAKKHKLVSENPASGLSELYTQAPTRHEKIEPLRPEEVPLFLEQVRASRHTAKHYALFLAAIHTGLRVGELAGLRWGDVDWHGKLISVERACDRVYRKVVRTKNKKHRRVDASDELLAALAELRRSRREQYLARGQNEIPDIIFCNEKGGHMDSANLTERHYHKCLESAGLKRRRFHDLRHTYASLLLTAGAPIAYVSEQMGHSSIELTVKRYGHLEPSANRGFVNNLPGTKSAPQAHPALTASM